MHPAVRVSPGNGVPQPVLEVELNPGWTFDQGKRSFRSAAGEVFSPAKLLPVGSRMVMKAQSLRHADPASLSKNEQKLLRYIQIILPEGEQLEQLIAQVKQWPAVRHVSLPPAISLPAPAPRRNKT